ncbi:Os11g0632015 [Oryza sativa Japonica Group]|uniref:Os11g0632015 protein n=1 Tax=Oryza sativa subsp. japonica TaxID=39947 RepID=A0A0N7KT90_ORYSJ|nr:Os11g0632015 [Oryza sativa Japonica Group]
MASYSSSHSVTNLHHGVLFEQVQLKPIRRSSTVHAISLPLHKLRTLKTRIGVSSHAAASWRTFRYDLEENNKQIARLQDDLESAHPSIEENILKLKEADGKG